jgi:hypothetical protein
MRVASYIHLKTRLGEQRARDAIKHKPIELDIVKYAKLVLTM